MAASSVNLVTWQATPNPDVLKFRMEGEGWPSPVRVAQAAASLDAVESAYAGPDFISVSRRNGVDWRQLRPAVLMAIAEAQADLKNEGGDADGAFQAGSPRPDAPKSHVEAEILAILDRYVRPGISKDGGGLELMGFDEATGVVSVALYGACGGCPSARSTLKAGVEQTLRRFIAEVTEVVDVGENSPRLPRINSFASARPSRFRAPIFSFGGRIRSDGSGPQKSD